MLEIEGRAVKCTRLSKILCPQSRTTKADVIDYYVQGAPFILPHLKYRPLTLKRYPDGVRGDAFWEKDTPSFTPEWVETYPVPRRAAGPDIRYILVQNTATLAWLANAATLELHPSCIARPKVDGADLLQCIEVAAKIRTVLDRLSLKLLPKVSDSKGL